MKQSESITHLAAALVAVQAEVRGVAKDSTNPDFRSQYTSLDAIIEKTRPVLTKHGLAVVQGATTPHSDETGRIAAIAVETMLVHSSGEWLSNTAIMPVVGRMLKGGGRADPDPQSGGSALTYGRRYGIAALLCLSTDEDDDGNAASQQSGAKKGRAASAARSDAPTTGTGTYEPRQRPATAPAQLDQTKVMPFGESRGTALADMPIDRLAGAVKWARANKAEYYAAFIEAAELILDEKSAVGV